MASTIKVDQIVGSTGSTVTIPTGQTLTIVDGVPVASGGTGLASFTAGDILYATGSTTLAKLTKGTAEQVLAMNAGATAPDWGSVDLTALPTITVAKGGTNLSSFTAGDILYATGATTLAKLAKGAATEVIAMNAGATAPEWVSAGGGKTLVAPTRIAHDDTEVSASSSGTQVPDSGTALFWYPIGALLTGSFTKTSATSVLGIAYQYSIENNGTNQHDQYLWAGTGATAGTAGDNFKYHLGDDNTRTFNNQQFGGRTVYITGMSAAAHTIKCAAGTFPDRTHTYYYNPAQAHGDRSALATPSTMWAWEIEV